VLKRNPDFVGRKGKRYSHAEPAGKAGKRKSGDISQAFEAVRQDLQDIFSLH
jgi:hypothetical protein